MKHTLLLLLLTASLHAAPIDGSLVYPKDDGKKEAISSCKKGDCQTIAISKGRRDDDEPPPKPKGALSTLPGISTVNLPYIIEHYEAPAPVAPTIQIERNGHHGDDHGHHGQVPEPGTWALIGGGLMVVAWRRR